MPSSRVARIPRSSASPGRAANTAVLVEGTRLLINDPARCEGVRVIGVDEHVWHHTPYGDKYVTVILDVTPVHDRRSLWALGHGPGPIQAGLYNLAGLPARHVALEHRDRRDGWIHRLHKRSR